MSFSGNKRKGAPGDVLDEQRMPADPTDPAAGTLRGEKIIYEPLPCPTARPSWREPLSHRHD
eukprot:scaffold3933_cov155-Skeletonema_menzelii.AAC.3